MADESEVLLSLTRAHLNTGLRGVPVGTVRTSVVDPERGVAYVGYPVQDLAEIDPEAAIYLVFNRELPTPEQLAAFKHDLQKRAGVPGSVLDLVAGLPREGHPMEWLLAGLVFLGMAVKTEDVTEDAYNLIAKSPELIAAIFRLRSGWGAPIASRPELGLIENFVHMLGVPGGDARKLSHLLRVFYVLHMDHGGGNLSTFAGKAVASAGAHVYASMVASMAGLYGPLHGRANQECLEFVREIGDPDPKHIEEFVRARLAGGGVIPGFGHAVLRAEDPRAAIQYALGEELCPNDPLFRTAVQMRQTVVAILKGIPKISNPYPNVDAVSGTLLNACGLTDSNYYTLLFGLARIGGIGAQIVDERLHLRGGGKAVPIYRPKYVAVGQTPRRYNA